MMRFKRAHKFKLLRRAHSPMTTSLWILLILFTFLAISLPVVSIYLWGGGWRKAASAALFFMVGFIGFVLIHSAIDAASHPFWPFELLLASTATNGYIISLFIIRRITLSTKKRSSTGPIRKP